jgi:ABC-type polysaccharide/polyol phosphate transport system ATPase subunit
MGNSVELRGLGKRYWQLEERAMLLKSVVPFLRPKKSEFWALRNLDLSLEHGETLGVLGHNGAGKTTLLRMLAGVTRPTEGTACLKGRIAPLISVGVGFHQEMSGRENIYVNAMLLGLTRREIESRFDQIVDFAELADFIDTPVKFYSSGMFMRLGFSVAAHVDPDILLVDEVLAVGDGAFQVKCIERMRRLQQEGTTILIVSHSMHAIRLLCPRAILIRKGHLEYDGTAEGAIARHHQLMTGDLDPDLEGPAATILERELEGCNGRTHHPQFGEEVVYRLRVKFHEAVDTPQVHFEVVSESGIVAYEIYSKVGRTGQQFEPGETAEIEIRFRVQVGGGTYRLCTRITDRNFRDVYATDAQGLLMYVVVRPGRAGIADLDASISVDGLTVSGNDSLLLGEAPSKAPSGLWG